MNLIYRRLPPDDSGFALIAVLLAMALLTGIGAGLTAIGVVEFRTSLNHRSATRALLMADAGQTHALAIMRGMAGAYSYSDVLVGADGTGDTDDDGLLIGYPGLAEVDAIADTGVLLPGGRYFVTIVNDPDDPSGDPFVDTNDRVLAICRGETPDGGRAEVRAILASPNFPAIVTNGDLIIPGTPEILGPCAGVHANGRLLIDGNPIVDGQVTASDSVILEGTVYDKAGNVVIPGYYPPIEVPDYDPLDYCGEANYLLRDGWVVTVGPPRDSAWAGGPKVLGWKWDSVENTYTLTGKDAVPGTVCAYGNVRVSGNLGAAGDTMAITLLSTGSVRVGGTPVIKPAHSDGVLIVAEGDVQIGGNASATTPYYSGLIYAGSQCQVNGTPVVHGHILCYDAYNPPGAAEYVDANKVNGTPEITYDCSGVHQSTLVSSWWETRTL